MSNPKYYVIELKEAEKLPPQFETNIVCMEQLSGNYFDSSYHKLDRLDSPTLNRKCVAVYLEEEDLTLLSILGIKYVKEANVKERLIVRSVKEKGHYYSERNN